MSAFSLCLEDGRSECLEALEGVKCQSKAIVKRIALQESVTA